MTSKKAKPDAQKTSEDKLARQPLEVLIEVLATAAGQMQGLKGPELRTRVAEVTGQVQQLAKSIDQKVADEEQRKAAAKEVERLIDMFVRTGTDAGKALEKHREQITAQFRGVDLQQVAAGMRVLADWMANPSVEKEAEAKALLEKLQTTMGPLVGYDPKAAQEREDEKRRAEIKADVKKSLDDIFRPKKS
jgi:hypothetical protein